MEASKEDLLASAVALVAPGTALREAIDSIQAARSGALIVIGDEKQVAKISDGGFALDVPFESERLFEVSKMDGAIVLDDGCARILRANVHLTPDPALPTTETGIRHRTAERVSRQTDAVAIAISKRRVTVTLYRAGEKLVLEQLETVLAKANQALQTLHRYRVSLDEASDRLLTLEFADMVTLNAVVTVVQRSVAASRVATELERYIAELGSEGRLVEMQLEELIHSVDEDYALLLRDYMAEDRPRKVPGLRAQIAELNQEQLLEGSAVAHLLGHSAAAEVLESYVRPRGYRVLGKIPLLPNAVVNRLVERFGGLQAILKAGPDELDEVDGVGERRARAVIEGLRRLRDYGGP